jgi:hypothetical protein
MNLVVLRVPCIVYCVKMYVHQLYMRDKLWYCILTTSIVNMCKPLRFSGTQR